MKAGREHRVPLSAAVLGILEQQYEARINEFVFAGAKQGRPMSEMALLMLLRRMGRPDITVHGFRSTFRDWAAELTNHPREVAEAALAHTIPNAVEAAYRRCGTEPPRVFRRLFRLSHAAMAGSASMA
jgi:integrase